MVLFDNYHHHVHLKLKLDVIDISDHVEAN